MKSLAAVYIYCTMYIQEYTYQSLATFCQNTVIQIDKANVRLPRQLGNIYIYIHTLIKMTEDFYVVQNIAWEFPHTYL